MLPARLEKLLFKERNRPSRWNVNQLPRTSRNSLKKTQNSSEPPLVDDILYNGSRSLSRSLSFSLAIHALFFFACFLLIGQSQLHAPRTRSITIELEDPSEQLRKVRQSREDNKRRIVQSEHGQVVDQAVKDAFLGEKSQVVDRQTVNKDHTTTMGSKAQPRVAKPLTEA